MSLFGARDGLFGTPASASGGTKEVWFIATDYNANNGNVRERSVGGTGAHRFTFAVPADFNALVSLEMIGIPSAGAAGAGRDIDLFSDYGLPGEASNFNSESDTTTVYDYTGTSGQWTVLADLSVVFSALQAGHFCGLQWDNNSVGGAIDIIGIRMKYT